MADHERRIAIYSRKSKFTGKGESIGNQVELCREYVRAHYGSEASASVVVYEDEGFSGGNLNRPGFRQMMKAARDRQLRAIIVYRLDRISRNISDFAGLIQELAQLDVAFVSIREQFDTSSPMGRAMMYIASVFSQLERETIAERIRDNMRELAKTGRWLGGVTPTGYASESVATVTVEGKTHKACRLKLIPDEAALIRLIYDLYLEIGSLTGVEAELMKRCALTKNGRYFTRFAIRAILLNPVYAIADSETCRYFTANQADLFSPPGAFDGVHGMLAYNRTDQTRGRATVCLPVSEWIVCVGQHPGLIPGDRWVQVQDMLARNKTSSYRTPRRNEALLTGLLHCRCGGCMYPKLGRSSPGGVLRFSYVCKMKERSKGRLCDAPNADGNALDAAVVRQLQQLTPDNGFLIAQLTQSRRLFLSGQTRQDDDLSAMRQARSILEHKLSALVDSLADLPDNATRGIVTQRISKLNQELTDLDAHIRDTEQATEPPLTESDLSMAVRQLTSFSACLAELPLPRLRTVLPSLIHRIVLDGGNAQVFLPGAEEQPQPPCEDSK